MAGDSISSLFKDKRMQLAAAAVGGVGLLLLVMRKGGGSSGTGQTMIQPAAGLDSSRTDLYNAVQSLGQGWQNDLRGFSDQLTNVNDKLSKLPTGGTGNPPATGGTPSGAVYESVTGGTWLDTIAKKYGYAGNYDPIFALNPGLKQGPGGGIGTSNSGGFNTGPGGSNPFNKNDPTETWVFTDSRQIRVK